MAFPLRRVLDPLYEPVSLSDMKLYLRVDIDDDDSLISTLISLARERAEDLTGCCLCEQRWVFYMDRFPTWFGYEAGINTFVGHHQPHRNGMFRSEHINIILPRGPVLSVDSITYKDLSGSQLLLDPSTYESDIISEPARLTPLRNGFWPYSAWDTNSIEIQFTAGYQQTATETHTVPLEAPFTINVKRTATALCLKSITDATTGAPLVGAMTEGVVTIPAATPGQSVIIVYQVSSIPQSFIHAMKLMVGAWYENRAEVVQGGGNFNNFPTPLSASSLLGTYNLFKVGYPKG